MEMPIVSRWFHPYETHYVEEPLHLIDPDSPPATLYQSSEFEPILLEQADKVKPEPEVEKEEEKEEEVEEEEEEEMAVTDDSSHGAVSDGESLVIVNGDGGPQKVDSKKAQSDSTKSPTSKKSPTSTSTKSPFTSKKHDVNGNKIKENGTGVSVRCGNARFSHLSLDLVHSALNEVLYV
jgi:hypothetical protein